MRAGTVGPRRASTPMCTCARRKHGPRSLSTRHARQELLQHAPSSGRCMHPHALTRPAVSQPVTVPAAAPTLAGWLPMYVCHVILQACTAAQQQQHSTGYKLQTGHTACVRAACGTTIRTELAVAASTRGQQDGKAGLTHVAWLWAFGLIWSAVS